MASPRSENTASRTPSAAVMRTRPLTVTDVSVVALPEGPGRSAARLVVDDRLMRTQFHRRHRFPGFREIRGRAHHGTPALSDLAGCQRRIGEIAHPDRDIDAGFNEVNIPVVEDDLRRREQGSPREISQDEGRRAAARMSPRRRSASDRIMSRRHHAPPGRPHQPPRSSAWRARKNSAPPLSRSNRALIEAATVRQAGSRAGRWPLRSMAGRCGVAARRSRTSRYRSPDTNASIAARRFIVILRGNERYHRRTTTTTCSE